MTRSTSSFAFSLRMPVAWPSAARSISPPGGSAVAGPMEAARSAALFSQRACPSRLRSAAGRPPVTLSSSAAVGQRPQRFLSKRPPSSQAPSGSCCTAAAIRLSATSRVGASRRSSWPIWIAHHMKCTCASPHPGTMRPPRRSTRSAPTDAAVTSASRPTATMRPSRASRASAPAPVPVWMRPPAKRTALTRRTPRSRRAGRTAPDRPPRHGHRHGGR